MYYLQEIVSHLSYRVLCNSEFMRAVFKVCGETENYTAPLVYHVSIDMFILAFGKNPQNL